jgi:putative flippase GtrA
VRIHPNFRKEAAMKLQQWVNGSATNGTVQLFRYIIVGGSAFVWDFLILFILWDKFHVYYLLANCFSFVFGILYTYFLSTVWVFNSRTLENRWLELIIFTFIGIVGLGLAELFMYVFTDLMHIFVMYSKIIATLLVFLWNFFTRKILLFSNPGKRNQRDGVGTVVE